MLTARTRAALLIALAGVAGACGPSFEASSSTGATGTGAAATTTGVTGTGGSGGVTSSSASTGSTTGSGGGCVSAKECPDPGNECLAPACLDGQCSYVPVPMNLAVSHQILGNCQKEVCDGSGGVIGQPDDTDLEDDNETCTLDKCNAGAPVHTPTAAGTPCNEGLGNHVCDGAGKCVACNLGSDCSNLGTCTQHQCVPPPVCKNGVLDPSETDVDCGGATCPRCDVDRKCLGNADCESGVCKSNKCEAPSCTDQVKNGTESDVDCGLTGDGCSLCPIGKKCVNDGNCVTGSCIFGLCAPSCSDGVLDGNESDVDCGGICAKKCADTRHCRVNNDCNSGHCFLGVCIL